MFFSRFSTPWRVAAAGLAAALALSLLVAFTNEGRTLAAGFLAQFRSQQLVAIEVTPQSQAEIFRALNALGNFGTVQTSSGAARAPGSMKPEEPKTLSLAEASRVVGFPLQTPDPALMPVGFDKTPRVHVTPAMQYRFTFEKNKARTYFQSSGHPDVSLPDKFDGATLVISIPAVAMVEYGDASSKQALMVGQAGELVVDIEGNVSLDELGNLLVTLPGISPTTANQLRQIKNWNQTLPVPIPTDQVHWQPTTIKGNQALLLNDNSGIGSAAAWHADGHLFGVAGSLRATDLKRLAESLAVR